MNRSRQRYLEKRAMTGPWQISGIKRSDYAGVIVIPACDEEQWLFRTLDRLASNREDLLESFLVLVVINHPGGAARDVKTANDRTLEQFTASPLRRRMQLGWIDACSVGRELTGGGVGSARKLGFDLALPRLRQDIDPILVSLDADTLVEPNYLEAVTAHFAARPAGGGVLPFAHQKADNETEQKAIDTYELYMRCYQLGLKLAGSPYAFHSIGSAIACRCSAYLRCGGMNRRQGGEDFYFLQSLAKTGRVEQILGTTVYPSARLSRRVPFGTGPAMIRLIDNPDEKSFFPLTAFERLDAFLKLVLASAHLEGTELQATINSLCRGTGLFLHQQELAGNWDRLRRNFRQREKLMSAFHGWFDGLKTQQYLKYLARSAPCTRISAAEAVSSFFPKINLTPAAELGANLEMLRKWQYSPLNAGK